MLAKVRATVIHLLVLAAVLGVCTAASLTVGRVRLPWRLPGFPVLPVRVLEPGQQSPIALVRHGLPPDMDVAGTGPRHRRAGPSAAIRAIVVSPHKITLLAGGRVIESIPVARRSPDLPELVRAIADPYWINVPAPGVVVLRVALIIENRASLTVSPPAVRLLLLADNPGVLLGAHRRGILRIESTAIESPDLRYTGDYRPFVLAEQRSRLLIRHSLLAGLGWDYDDSYGVSWKTGSTGGATSSTFTGNFFGVYTGNVSGVAFTGNLVAGNYSYGIDPHSYSSRLTITGNTVTANGRHGIILADHVTRSVVVGNTVRGNAANGIMMYGASTGNVIERNTVAGNRGDGIVCTASPGNRVIGNVVRGNRVGLHIERMPPRTVAMSGNIVTGNALNSEGIAAAAGNTVASNVHLGWDADWLTIIWLLGTVLLVVTLMSLTSCLLGN
jgi:parallel beta-helix repeat protein